MDPRALRRLRMTFVHVVLLAVAGMLIASPPVQAHWCSNIYESGARLVIKPEQSTVFPGMNPGDSTTLRVWVRNNFPYVMTNAEMRATSADFRASLEGMQNPYGDGTAAKRIVAILRDTPLDGLLVKRVVG